MTSDQLKAFITQKMCCVQQKVDKGYLNISRGGKDPMCDTTYAFLANAILHVLRCTALEETCRTVSENSDCTDPQADIEGSWIVTEVCVASDCSTEYSAVEFVGMIDQEWIFSSNSSSASETYDGSVNITSPHAVGEEDFDWAIATNGTVTTDFSFEPPSAFVGKIFINNIDCNTMTINFEQSGLDPVVVTLVRSSYLDSTETECEFHCLTDDEICAMVNWLKRYCKDCNNYDPKPLTTTPRT